MLIKFSSVIVIIFSLLACSEEVSTPAAISLSSPSSPVFSPEEPIITVKNAPQIELISQWQPENQVGFHYLWHIAWSPDSTKIATGGQDGIIWILDPAGVSLIQTLESPILEIFSLSWSPDSAFLAAGYEDQYVRIWNVTLGKEVLKININANDIYVAWSPRGDWLATGDANGNLLLWESATGKFVKALRGHTN